MVILSHGVVVPTVECGWDTHVLTAQVVVKDGR